MNKLDVARSLRVAIGIVILLTIALVWLGQFRIELLIAALCAGFAIDFTYRYLRRRGVQGGEPD